MGSWPRTGSHILPVETVQDTEEQGLDAVKFSAGRISWRNPYLSIDKVGNSIYEDGNFTTNLIVHITKFSNIFLTETKI